MMRLRLVEGKPPEAGWSECLEDYGVYGEAMDGVPFVVGTDRVEVSLKDGSRIRTRMRPLPPGTIITITVLDAAPHSVCVDRPKPAVEWLHWNQVEPGGVVVSENGYWYRKMTNDSGYSGNRNQTHRHDDMICQRYRRPFNPWHLVPVEEPTP